MKPVGVCLSITAGSKASESQSVQILDTYTACMSCAQHAQVYWHHVNLWPAGFKDSRTCVPCNPGGNKWQEMKAQQARSGESKVFGHTDYLNTPFVASTQSQFGKLISSS